MNDADPGPWEPFLNSTYNGTYWAIHRGNSRCLGGMQTMLTAAGKPRRFGSESAARRAADAANKLG